jgi:hypothetical protein
VEADVYRAILFFRQGRPDDTLPESVSEELAPHVRLVKPPRPPPEEWRGFVGSVRYDRLVDARLSITAEHEDLETAQRLVQIAYFGLVFVGRFQTIAASVLVGSAVGDETVLLTSHIEYRDLHISEEEPGPPSLTQGTLAEWREVLAVLADNARAPTIIGLSVRARIRACYERSAMDRVEMNAQALEPILQTDRGNGRSQFSARVPFLLGQAPPSAEERRRFERVYALRGDIVHGRRIATQVDEPEMRALEGAADAILRRVLRDPTLRAACASPDSLRSFWRAQPPEYRESPEVTARRDELQERLRSAQLEARSERRRRVAAEAALEEVRQAYRKLKGGESK